VIVTGLSTAARAMIISEAATTRAGFGVRCSATPTGGFAGFCYVDMVCRWLLVFLESSGILVYTDEAS